MAHDSRISGNWQKTYADEVWAELKVGADAQIVQAQSKSG